MKKSIFTYASLILSAATLLSCQKLEEVNEPLVATGTHSVIVTTDATRTVNDDMHTYFEDGDKMTVIYKRDGSSNYHANEYTYSASSGQFTGDASLSSRYSYNWWGIYPYSSSNTSATSVSVSIPVSQTQVGNDSKAALAGEGFPLVGKTNALVKGDATPQFNVSNVATVLDFKITNGSATPLTVTKVEFTAPSGIAGTFSADLTQSTISWKAASSASKTVTLNVVSGEAIANGAVAHFYAGAGPFSGSGSYTIEVTAKDAEGQTFVSSKTINGSLDCKSSTINTISHTFVPGEPVTEKTYTKVTSFTSGKKYVIVYDGKALQNNGGTPAAYSVTASGNTLTLSSDVASTLEWTATTVSTYTVSGHYSLTNNGKYAARTDDGKNGFEFQTSAVQKAVWDLDSDGNDLYHKNSNGQYTFYLTYSSSKWTVNSQQASNKIAVYAEDGDTPVVPPTPSTEKTYKKVTTALTDWSGTYLIVKESANVAFAYNQTNFTTPVTISNGTITTNDLEAYEVTISESSLGAGKYDVKVGGQYLYKYGSSTNLTFFDSNISGNNQYFAEFSGSSDININFHRSGGSDNYFQYNGSKFCFGGTSSSTVQLYKLSDGGDEPATKQTQTLSFENPTVEWTLGDEYEIGGTYDPQSVNDAKTTVTLSSSNTAVATISDGKIKIVDEGTTTIIATAAEDDTYYGASASYTLTIKPAPAPITEKCYVKVTSAPQDWSGTYIIVDESAKKAFDENASSYASTVGISDGKIAWSETVAKYEIKVSPSSVSGMYELKTVNGKYMYSYNYGETTLNSSNKDNRSRIYYNSLSISGGNVTMFSTRGEDGSVNYFGYVSNTSENPNKKNFGYKEDATSRTVQFYKLSEGGDEPATKQDQNLSFTKSSKTINSDTFTLGSGTYIAPTLIGAMTTPVTWTSSKTSVATVSNSGAVTIVAAGTTTITASAPASDEYNAASASYTLTVSPAQEQPTTKTYTKVNSISEGTYIICGSETAGTYVCLFPPVDATYSNQDKKFDTTNKCNHSLFSSSNTITEIKTSDTSIIGSEVEITASGSSWLIKLKSNGLYMYYNNDKIDFTSTSSSAAQTIGSFSSGKTSMKQGNQLFYHSGTNEGFGYKNRSNVSNLMFFKLDEGSTPDTPDTPAQSSLNIENKQLAAYLDAVEKQPYFSNNTFGSYSSYYTSSLMSDNKYYSGSSSSNRLDQPAPVVITWSGNATKIEVFTSSSKTPASRVASESFSSSSSASIYNLIPGQKYYYTATNGTTTVATGDFTPEGRRRMIRVSSSFDDSHAANCRDFGGLPTVDGKHVKYGLIYRGSNIDGLSTDDKAKEVFLNTMKIKWDIDLRASNEKGSAPTLTGVSKGTQSYSASFNDENLRSKTKVKATLKEIINAINKDTPEPVYIHCRIGSDRTGYICLLVEALIGVTQNYCDTDYEITSFTGSVTGTRFRVDNTWGGGMYKSGIQYFENYSGTTLHEKVYNFVTSSEGLNISKDDVDKFISRMKE